MWVVTNTGLDTALDVTVSATFANESRVEQRDEVRSGESIRFDITELSQEVHKRNKEAMHSAPPGIVYIPTSNRPIAHRVVWLTPAGAWKVDVFGPQEVSL